MRKIPIILFAIFLICMNVTICMAGDVPEGLLGDEDSLVYFGEVTEIEDAQISVLVTENIKGTAEVDRIYVYDEWAFTSKPQVGEVYLCGYSDENNPLYIWEISSTDMESLDIINDDNMSKRMEDYINNGDFSKAQDELSGVEESDAEEDSSSVGIIGSADGPSGIYINERDYSGVIITGAIALGIIVIACVVILNIMKSRKK